MRQLFGTDGIRGRANRHPVTSEMALAVGRAVTRFFAKKEKKPLILIGQDTRISGDMLACGLASGICSMGGNVLMAGILPTPGIACLTIAEKADAGIVISASHNPFYDNGIKIFKGNGFKLSDEEEAEIEKLIIKKPIQDAGSKNICETIEKTGSVRRLESAADQYSEFLKKSMPDNFSLQGIKVVLDCSQGATYQVAPKLFEALEADVTTLFATPDGVNINEQCGSQHLEAISKTVVDTKADLGLAFDGDGDRLIALDEKGNPLTGDKILAICAGYMKGEGSLINNIAVTTVMSNIGLGMALQKQGIDHRITDVGDRYVMEEMLKTGAVIGGEDSGHMIFLDQHTTGDGILTALRLIEAWQASGTPLSGLSEMVTIYPQVLINVPVREKPDLDTIPGITAAIRKAESALGEKGRVLVRYSGTQLKCRVMAEGPTEEETRMHCERIVKAVRETIGAL